MEGTSGVFESNQSNLEISDNISTNISHIPDEILFRIFYPFDEIELPTLSLVCKKWKDISLDPHLYRNLYKTYFPERSVPPLENNENWHRGLFREIDHHIQEFKQIPACQELMKTFSRTTHLNEAFITLRELRDIHNLEILYSIIICDCYFFSYLKRQNDYNNLTNCNKLKFIREEIFKRLNPPSQPITFLYISRKLTSLPREIGYFSQLKTLKTDHTTITSLPAEIGKLINLRHLILSQNKLTNLPPEIGHLSLLQELSIRHNQLESLPAEIGKLKELEELDLEHNKIRYLPQSIRNLPKIKDKCRIAFEKYATEE